MVVKIKNVKSSFIVCVREYFEVSWKAEIVQKELILKNKWTRFSEILTASFTERKRYFEYNVRECLMLYLHI